MNSPDMNIPLEGPKDHVIVVLPTQSRFRIERVGRKGPLGGLGGLRKVGSTAKD